MFKPDNDLEQHLVAAALEPESSSRVESFYRALIESRLFIISAMDVQPAGSGKLVAAGAPLLQWKLEDGRMLVPLFTSPARVKDFCGGETDCAGVEARRLLELIDGNPAMLNPGSEYGKELLASEIAGLLDGAAPSAAAASPEAPHTPIQVLESDSLPVALTRALRSLFAALPEVDAAYLAQCVVPDSDDRPHPVIGIEGRGDLSTAMHRARRVAQRHLEDGDYVDFVRVGENALSRYLMRKTRPFYRRNEDRPH